MLRRNDHGRKKTKNWIRVTTIERNGDQKT